MKIERLTIKNAVIRAVKEKNALAAGIISDHLWFKHGMNYNEQVAFVNKVADCSPADWEELMYEADTL